MKQLSNHVWLLGNRHSNHFLVGREDAAIVECGVSAGVACLQDQWDSLQPRPRVNWLLVLHAHFDHVCGVPALREGFPEARVVAGAKAAEVLARPKIVRGFFEQDATLSRLLKEQGVLTRLPETRAPEVLQVDRVVTDGDRLGLNSHLVLHFLEAPGHSACSLACWLPEENILFPSDACGFQVSDDVLFPIFFLGYEIYLETIEKLRGLPVHILAMPHERVWEGAVAVQAFFDRALWAAEDMFQRIRGMIHSGMEEEALKKALFDQCYQGDLRIYTPENIGLCVDLLVKRVRECL